MRPMKKLSFGYSLLNCGSDNLIGLYRDYDVFFAHQKATCRLALKNYLADNVGYEDYQKLSKLKSKDIKESEGSIWMLID